MTDVHLKIMQKKMLTSGTVYIVLLLTTAQPRWYTFSSSLSLSLVCSLKDDETGGCDVTLSSPFFFHSFNFFFINEFAFPVFILLSSFFSYCRRLRSARPSREGLNKFFPVFLLNLNFTFLLFF